jgi:hypothetical protein
MVKTVLKTFGWLCAILFMYAFFAMMSLKYQYTREMPNAPQKATGRVCAISAYYGKTVYVTKEEEQRLSARYYYILGTGLLAVLAEFARRVAVAAGREDKKKSDSALHQG